MYKLIAFFLAAVLNSIAAGGMVSQKEIPTRKYEKGCYEVWTGTKLTKGQGVNWGPTGKETWYDMPMSGVVRIMRGMGFDEEEWPYWIDENGLKRLGKYIMVAADLNHFPRGSLVECSWGTGIVCDTGGFIYMADGWNQLDIATAWGNGNW